MVHFVIEISAKISAIGLIIAQGLMLDRYLVLFHNKLWWLWVIVDVFMLITWIVFGVLLWRASKKKEEREERKKNDLEMVDGDEDDVDGFDLTKSPDEIRHAYIVWVVYAMCLVPRVVILYRKDASTLLERNILGPNFLKVAVSCTPLLFLLLAYALHDRRKVAARRYLITSLVSTITLDLFDSIDLLEFLFEPEDQLNFPRPILDATLAFACINFFLPTLALMEIRMNRFNGQVSSLPFKILYECSYVFLVNVPNLVIRSVLWHKYNANVSVLVMKNIMCICLGCSEMVRYFGEERPKRCWKCLNWFEPEAIKTHLVKCHAKENTPLHQESKNIEL